MGAPGGVRRRRSLRRALWDARRSYLTSAYDNKGLILRVLADLVTANAGLFLGYVTTVVYHVWTADELPRGWIRDTLASRWLGSVPLFTSVCLLAFALSGLYSHAPGFRPLHKFALAFRAVGIAFLMHTLGMYFTRSMLPRSAVLSGWVLVVTLVAGVRVARNLFLMRYKVEPRNGPRSSTVRSVLVVGGAGYIGSVLVRNLLRADYFVRVLDRLLYGDASIRGLYGEPDFEFIKGDFRSVESVVRAVRGIDAVIHLGAIVGDPACALDEETTIDVNTNAVRMIREVCRGYGVRRFLFASTCSVYGAREAIIDERSKLAPVSLYAKSKIAAEQAILESLEADFRPTILRLATAFGLSYRMRFDLVVNLLTARAVTEGKITIFNGQQWRPFIHVSDIARAFLTCLQAPVDTVGGRLYNVGDDRLDLMIAQLGDIIANTVPGTEVVNEKNISDCRSYNVDFSKVAGELGFECLTTVEQGVGEIAGALRAGRLGSYKDPIYSNVAALKNAGVVQSD